MMRMLQTTPDIMAALAPLASYENSALKELVENDVKVEEYVQNLPQSKSFVEGKEEKMAQNKSIAEYNLALKPVFESGKNNLKELSVQINALSQTIQEKEDRIKKNGASMNAETALALLQTAAAETEEESEKVADLFYQKDLDVEEFLEKFQDTRKRMHLRRVKADKMVELLSDVNKRPTPGVPRRPAPRPPYPVDNAPPTFPFRK